MMAKKGKPGKKGNVSARTAKQAAPVKKPRKVKPVPDGYHTITAHIFLDDAAGAIDFYQRAFGAKERLRMPGPDGKIAHAEVMIGDSVFMLSDEMAPMPGQPGVYKAPKNAGHSTGALFLYLPNVDAAFDRAIKSGCTLRTPPTDMFWGDRFGQVIDPFGHTWGLATHTEDLSPKEISKRQEEFFASLKP
jgi:PhnB protein